MKICRISRPPVDPITKKFPNARAQELSKRMKGEEILIWDINPTKIPNLYLAYSLGILVSLVKFKSLKADMVLAGDIESGILGVLIKFIFRVPFVFDFMDDYSLIASYD